MTLEELSQLYWLNREIELDQKRLDELWARAENPSGRFPDGTPPHFRAADRHGELAAELADLADVMDEKRRRCIRERTRLERYIAGIGDSLTRQIFTLRFVNGLPWGQVAACISESMTDKYVSNICYRYLDGK